jgi:hypothetical protein
MVVFDLRRGRDPDSGQPLSRRRSAGLDDSAPKQRLAKFHAGRQPIWRLAGACCGRTDLGWRCVLARKQALDANLCGNAAGLRVGGHLGSRGQGSDRSRPAERSNRSRVERAAAERPLQRLSFRTHGGIDCLLRDARLCELANRPWVSADPIAHRVFENVCRRPSSVGRGGCGVDWSRRGVFRRAAVIHQFGAATLRPAVGACSGGDGWHTFSRARSLEGWSSG